MARNARLSNSWSASPRATKSSAMIVAAISMSPDCRAVINVLTISTAVILHPYERDASQRSCPAPSLACYSMVTLCMTSPTRMFLTTSIPEIVSPKIV